MLKIIAIAVAAAALVPVSTFAKDHEKGEHRERGDHHRGERGHVERHDRDRGEHRGRHHHRRDHRGWYFCGGLWSPVLIGDCDFDD